MPAALSSTTTRRIARARSIVSWTGPCGSTPDHCVATSGTGQEAFASGGSVPRTGDGS